MPRRLALIPIALSLIATTSWAEKPAPSYSRPGWYVGVGAGGGVDFLSEAVQDATGGFVDLSVGGSFNARGGYRVTSWFAFEVMYEGVYGTEAEILGMKSASSFSTHGFVGNFKFIAPIWRVHPYFMLGPGAQYGIFDGKGPFSGLDLTRWDFMLRTAFGIDAYITENWLVNLELAPSIRFADYGDIPSEVTDNVTLTFGAGVQYRW
jgi:hypothetical protein